MPVDHHVTAVQYRVVCPSHVGRLQAPDLARFLIDAMDTFAIGEVHMSRAACCLYVAVHADVSVEQLDAKARALHERWADVH